MCPVVCIFTLKDIFQSFEFCWGKPENLEHTRLLKKSTCGMLPEIYLRFFRYIGNIHKICLSFVWDVHVICMRMPWDMPKIARYMPKISLRFALHLPYICQRCAWDMPEICIMHNMYLRYAWDIPEICLRYSWDKSEIWLRCMWDMLVMSRACPIIWNDPQISCQNGTKAVLAQLQNHQDNFKTRQLQNHQDTLKTTFRQPPRTFRNPLDYCQRPWRHLRESV